VIVGSAENWNITGLASGKQFDALFVDEGFGSLDPDALDDAVSALSLLQAGGRVVGAITHVEAIKERLHVGIEVKRLGDAKGSTLTVYP
jgi:exonuclease SbcC